MDKGVKAHTEDQRLHADARRNRRLDRELARALGRPLPAAMPPEQQLGDLEPRRAIEAERALVRRAQAGDADARARLVEAFLPAVRAAARTYRGSGAVTHVELLQEGVVGLLRALERYEPDRGVPFWGYASWWVRQAMQQLVAELTGPAVLSDRALRHLARVKDAHAAAVRETGRQPGREELADRSGLTVDQVDDLLAVERAPRSLDEPIAGDDGEVGTFGDLLADPLAADEYERVLRAIETEWLHSLLCGLSDRERDVLRHRYGLAGEEESLRQVAARLGVSAERVRQIEQRALGKLAAAAAPAATP